MDLDSIECIDFNGNTAHATARATAAEITEVFMNGPDIRRNRPGRAAAYLAFGRTNGGRKLVVPFVYDDVRRAARPITAWEDQ